MSAVKMKAVRRSRRKQSTTVKEPSPLLARPAAKKQPYPIRVFVSYSHSDSNLPGAVIAHLKDIGALPISDHEIRVGEAFSVEIRQMIECAHVFMPILTRTANRRLWVHQEIGYATALRVPVCPLAIGQLPKGMAEHIQAIHVTEDGSDLGEKLKYRLLASAVRCAQEAELPAGRFECASELHDRQVLLARYTQQAWRNCQAKYIEAKGARSSRFSPACRVRQCTAFTSFSIPDTNIALPVWDVRDGKDRRSRAERRLLRRERQLMEKQARSFGCDLIMDPYVRVPSRTASSSNGETGMDEESEALALKHSTEATRLRLNLLMGFIQDMSDAKLHIAIPKEENRGLIQKNLIIVGDWFAAEAVVPYYLGGGYQQTIFTHHGPTVLRKIDEFDQDFEDILKESGTPRHRSRRASIEVIREELEKLGE